MNKWDWIKATFKKIHSYIKKFSIKRVKHVSVGSRETKSQELVRRFLYNKSAVFGLVLILILVFMALFADFIAPNDPNPSPPELENSLKPGFWDEEGAEGKPLGTDMLGRCVLSRIVYGARISLSVGFVAVGIATALGVTIGVLAGYFGKWVDSILMRGVDIVAIIPVWQRSFDRPLSATPWSRQLGWNGRCGVGHLRPPPSFRHRDSLPPGPPPCPLG